MSSHVRGRVGLPSSLAPSSRSTSRANRSISKGISKDEQIALKLTGVHAKLLHHKMRLVEKLLDVHMHDKLSTTLTELRRNEREKRVTHAFPSPISIIHHESQVIPKDAGEDTPSRYSARENSRTNSKTRNEGERVLYANNTTPVAVALCVSEVEHAMRLRLRDECRVNAALALDVWFTSPRAEGFVFAALHRLASMTQAEARREVRAAVAHFVDPHLRALRERRCKERVGAEAHGGVVYTSGALHSVELAVRQAVGARRRKQQQERPARAELQRADRVHRLQLAVEQVKKDLGDVSSLRYVVPVCYAGSEVSRRAAELRRLRARVQKNRVEENKLREQLETARAGKSQRVFQRQKETDALQSAKTSLLREVSLKQADREELPTIHGGDASSWAAATLEMEFQLTQATREEERLWLACEEARQRLYLLAAEKNRMEANIGRAEADLKAVITEEEEIAAAMTRATQRTQGILVYVRQALMKAVREINVLRENMLSHRIGGGESSVKRLKTRMLIAVAQLAVEDLLHARLTSQVQGQQEELQIRRENVARGITMKDCAKQEHGKEDMGRFEEIVELAKELVRCMPLEDHPTRQTIAMQGRSSNQIQNSIHGCHDACMRIRVDTVNTLTCRRMELARAQNLQRLLDSQLCEWKIREETLLRTPLWGEEFTATGHISLSSPLPIAATLATEAKVLYNVVAHVLHRKGRCRAILKLLHQHTDFYAHGHTKARLRFRSASLTPTSPRRIGKRSTTTTSRREGGDYHTSSPPHAAAPSMSPSIATPMRPVPLTPSAARRKMVLQFVKNEIQPLYDANRITRVRFMDVVESVSRGFLDAHPQPAPVLTESDKEFLYQQIQSTLLWQDEERSVRCTA